MKRNHIIKNISRILLSAGILTVTLLSSCKDNSPGSLDLSKSPALVGFQYKGFNAVPMNTKIFQQPNQVRDVEVTLSVASLTLSSPVTVTVADDPAGLANYVANTDSKAVALPTADYTIASNTITIPAGKQMADVVITLAGDKIDFSQDNVIALKITSASGAIVASNLNEIVLPIVLQSVYEGEYVNNGSFDDVVNTSLNGQIYPENIDLLTVTASSVYFYDLTYNVGEGHPIDGGSSYYGGFDPQFNFDLTSGKITSVVNAYGQGNNNRSAELDASGVNAAIGTPGTAGFKIEVKYIMHQDNTGVDRTFFNETYTYLGPAQ
jgi:hypothetical protein